MTDRILPLDFERLDPRTFQRISDGGVWHVAACERRGVGLCVAG